MKVLVLRINGRRLREHSRHLSSVGRATHCFCMLFNDSVYPILYLCGDIVTVICKISVSFHAIDADHPRTLCGTKVVGCTLVIDVHLTLAFFLAAIPVLRATCGDDVIPSAISNPLVLCRYELSSWKIFQTTYFLPPEQEQIPLNRIVLIRTRTRCGSPDLVIPLFMLDGFHFITSKESIAISTRSTELSIFVTYIACRTPVRLLKRDSVDATA